MTPPLRARLHWYQLTASEFALLTAMCEFRSDGAAIWASVPRLAAYAKISVRTAQRAIKALCERGVLVKTSPEDPAQRKPATYRIAENKFQLDPKIQKTSGQEISTLSSPVCHQTGANLSHTGDRLSDDSRTDSRFNSFPPQPSGFLVRNTTPRSAMRLTGANSALPGKSCS